MNKRRTTAIVILFSTILAGTYTAISLGAPPNQTGTETPIVTFTYEGCFYVWAYQELPEITTQFDQTIKERLPEANGRAQAFGEDCVYADGRVEFSAKETDFYVRIPTDDLMDEEELGDRMAAVMTIVLERFPSETLPGGHNGFVELVFEESPSQFLVLRVPIQRYKNDALGKTGAELFRMFHQNP